jgi:phage head maturation protease
MPAPTDDLYRGMFDHSVELRAEGDDDGTTMYGHFAVFDQWTEIDSIFEGRFLERLTQGSFKRTFNAQRDQVRVAFDHGFDPQIGDKPLGPPTVLKEEAAGAYYEVPLLDTDYNRGFVLPALEGRLMDGTKRGPVGILGASFRFRVIADEWNDEPGRSDHNPDGVPERTIKEVRLYEFGPVVYPAYEGATAKVRSLTDHYRKKDIARRGAVERAADFFQTDPASPVTDTEAPTPDSPATRHLEGNTGRDPRVLLAQVEAMRLRPTA